MKKAITLLDAYRKWDRENFDKSILYQEAFWAGMTYGWSVAKKDSRTEER